MLSSRWKTQLRHGGGHTNAAQGVTQPHFRQGMQANFRGSDMQHVHVSTQPNGDGTQHCATTTFDHQPVYDVLRYHSENMDKCQNQ